jgi:YfiH family protein
VFASRDRITGEAGVVDVAFTDRHGGVSAPPYDSLDLSLSAADRADEVAQNLRLLADAFGVDRFELMRQVHGFQVVTVRRGPADPPPQEWPQCDALVTDRPEVALCVRVGDCVPVLLADADKGVVGVAHAGRSGVAGGVVPRTVAAMRDLGADEIVAWIGPHVCGGCYEVPEDMRADVASIVRTTYAVTTWGTPALDLGAGVTMQLEEHGVETRTLDLCTRESPDLYSHRRDGANAGRLGGLVVLRQGAA